MLRKPRRNPFINWTPRVIQAVRNENKRVPMKVIAFRLGVTRSAVANALWKGPTPFYSEDEVLRRIGAEPDQIV